MELDESSYFLVQKVVPSRYKLHRRPFKEFVALRFDNKVLHHVFVNFVQTQDIVWLAGVFHRLLHGYSFTD